MKWWHWLIKTAFGAAFDSSEFSVRTCNVCNRWMRDITSVAGSRVRICPRFHTAIIALSAADVRSSLPLIEVSEDVRAMRNEIGVLNVDLFN